MLVEVCVRTAGLGLLLIVMACDEPGSSDRTGPSSTDLEGVYEVVDFQRTTGSCDGATEAATPDYAHFEVRFEDVFGFETLALVPCDGPSDCGGGLLTAVYFDSYSDSRASGTADITSHSSGECTLTWITSTLDADGADVLLTVTREEIGGVSGIDLDDCIEQQEAWSASKPCVSIETTRGSPL